MTSTATKGNPNADLLARLAELEAKLNASEEKVKALEANKGVGRRAPEIKDSEMAPADTILGKLHRAPRNVQSEALAKFGRYAPPLTMCDWVVELAERLSEIPGIGKSAEELIADAITMKSRNRAPKGDKVVDDQT